MHREPDVGFDPGSLGSRPGPKAGAKPLHHPGIPAPTLKSGNAPQFKLLTTTTTTSSSSSSSSSSSFFFIFIFFSFFFIFFFCLHSLLRLVHCSPGFKLLSAHRSDSFIFPPLTPCPKTLNPWPTV